MPTTTNSKLPYPATTDPADVPGDLQKLAAALDTIAYAEITAPVNVSTTTEATATTIVTAPAVTFDGATPVWITFGAAYVQIPGSVGANLTFALYDGAASIGQIWTMFNQVAAIATVPVAALPRRLTPSAGPHTYSIRSFVSGGTAPVGAGAGGPGNQMPAFIRITRA